MSPSPPATDFWQTLYSLIVTSWNAVESIAEVFTKLFKAVSWPLVALGFMLLFKKEVAKVVDKLKDMKWLKSGPFSTEFGKEERNDLMNDISSIFVPPSPLGPSVATETDDSNHRPIPVYSSAIDIDGDGLTELLVISQDGPYWSTLRVYRFSAPESFPRNARFLEIANLSGILGYKIKTRLHANPLIVIDVDDPDSGLPHAVNDKLLRKSYTWKDGELTLLSEERLLKPYTTYEMTEQAAKDIDELLAEKDALITEMKKKFDSNHQLQSQVIDADRAFITYLESETRLHFTFWSSGSIRSIASSTVKKRLLNERIKLLEDWLNRDEGEIW